MYFALDRKKNPKTQIVLTLSHAASQSLGQKTAQNYQSHYAVWFHMFFF